MNSKVNWHQIEEKWQKAWSNSRIFEADPIPGKPKFFITCAFPYPNSPQHIGHARTYSLCDAYARYKRMKGFNVLFPMGFHYTGTPIVAMSKLIREGDKETISVFEEIYHIPSDLIPKFSDPLFMARYFHEEIKQGMKEMGFSIDWRREFTSIDPIFSRFIHWQFRKLKEKGYISRGSHPVGWCPSCENPVGQHDTLSDVEPDIGELLLIKFRIDDCYIPTSTLRPETVFGVTNIWVNPDALYVKAQVDEEEYIISEPCLMKLKLLGRRVEIVSKLNARELIGRKAKNPITGEEVPILPAKFVDPGFATGIVMSVPAHAPYDYMALKELRENPEAFQKYGIEGITIPSPFPVIKVEGLSQIPASDMIKKYRIKSQIDPKLKDATKELYSLELRKGVMLENTGEYSGKSVAEARNLLREYMILSGKADIMFELMNRPVYCRCGSECFVKILQDQWFINYGLPEWKDLARECLETMSIIPESLRKEYRDSIDWMKERACARKRGLGTRLPWDPDWIIESLSDSTIYMCYYLISKYINQHGLKAEYFTDEVFDFIFLGIGDAELISKTSGISKEILNQMRNEFLYFYPVDCRHSGRDLVPNHLTFYIFNHVAIFSPEYWPRQIVVNGSVLMQGKKMSKSLRNIIPLREAIAKYGADTLRLSVLSAADILTDVNFSESLAESLKTQLESFYRFAVKVAEMKREAKVGPLKDVDKWMIGKVQEAIKRASESMEELRVRDCIQSAFFLLNKDVQWYMRRVRGELDLPERRSVISEVLANVLNVQVRLMAPFIPHICEEIWHLMGNEGFVSLSEWPAYDQSKIDWKSMETEEFIKSVFEDTLDILRVLKFPPKRICYYLSSSKKWNAYLECLRMVEEEGKIDIEKISKLIGKDTAKKMAESIFELSPEVRRRRIVQLIDEVKAMEEAKNFFERELKCQVEIYVEDDPNRYDPMNRAERSMPYKPAIYIE